MSSSFRRLSKSTVGTLVMALILVLVLLGFAVGDIQNVIRGGSFGGSADTLAKIGSERLSERDMSRAMERRLAQVRQEDPEASYASIIRDFDPVLNSLLDARTLEAFASNYKFVLSKRLVDGQIATIPAAKGLNGQFSEQAYASFLQQQRITDEEVRMIIRNGLLQQLLLAPAAVNAWTPVGMATPYASILLEIRDGEVALVPVAAFRAGLNPTGADLQRYYAANQGRYMIPEQRVIRLAKIGPEQVGAIQPTDQEIAADYKANSAIYAPKSIRIISQAVVPDQKTAQAIAARARAGQSFVAASAPAGLSAADISVGPQTREQFAALAGQQVASAAFDAQQGAIVGPIQSDLGWHVVRIDQVQSEGGKTLQQARAEILAKLTTRKRKEAIDALVDKVQTALDDGQSFSEAVATAKLAAIETPAITATGVSRSHPNYRFPAEFTPALKSGFELAENDEPVIDTLPDDSGYVLVAPARIIAAAPAPFESIRERVTQDWTIAEARQRARALAEAIASKAAKASVADAAKDAAVPVQVQPVKARRIQLAQFQGKIPPPLRTLFSLGQGKVRTVGGSSGEGFYVVKLNRITPGNALSSPGLITSTQQQIRNALSQEYGQQFLNAMRSAVGVKRNESAIAAAKTRISGNGN